MKKICWLARDKDGSIWVWKVKPFKGKDIWYNNISKDAFKLLDETLYPEIKWEDDEPTEAEMIDGVLYLAKDNVQPIQSSYYSEPTLSMPIPACNKSIYNLKP